MTARLVYRVIECVDRERFSAAVRDGLTLRELALRFGLSRDTARILRKQLTKGESMKPQQRMFPARTGSGAIRRPPPRPPR